MKVNVLVKSITNSRNGPAASGWNTVRTLLFPMPPTLLECYGGVENMGYDHESREKLAVEFQEKWNRKLEGFPDAANSFKEGVSSCPSPVILSLYRRRQIFTVSRIRYFHGGYLQEDKNMDSG